MAEAIQFRMMDGKYWGGINNGFICVGMNMYIVRFGFLLGYQKKHW